MVLDVDANLSAVCLGCGDFGLPVGSVAESCQWERSSRDALARHIPERCDPRSLPLSSPGEPDTSTAHGWVEEGVSPLSADAPAAV